jgi:hypothetical protein
MNAESRCLVDYIIAANQGVLKEAIPQAQEMVEAGTTTEAGQFIVTCERCEVDFELSPEVGLKGKMVVAKMPIEPSIACVEARFHEPYEWVTNLSPRWFDLNVIKPKETTASAEKGGDVPNVSLEGLEEVLSDAAENVARDRRMRKSKAKPDHNQLANGLTPYALSTSRLLDKILPRPDDSTWGTEISERATNIGDQAT